MTDEGDGTVCTGTASGCKQCAEVVVLSPHQLASKAGVPRLICCALPLFRAQHGKPRSRHHKYCRTLSHPGSVAKAAQESAVVSPVSCRGFHSPWPGLQPAVTSSRGFHSRGGTARAQDLSRSTVCTDMVVTYRSHFSRVCNTYGLRVLSPPQERASTHPAKEMLSIPARLELSLIHI